MPITKTLSNMLPNPDKMRTRSPQNHLSEFNNIFRFNAKIIANIQHNYYCYQIIWRTKTV